MKILSGAVACNYTWLEFESLDEMSNYVSGQAFVEVSGGSATRYFMVKLVENGGVETTGSGGHSSFTEPRSPQKRHSTISAHTCPGCGQ
jgi:hypothetical protein